MKLLELQDIHVKYGNIAALKGVSLSAEVSAEAGQIVCLIGANGAGKSTLLKAVMGIVPLSGGEIIYNEKVIHSAQKRVQTPIERLVAAGIALVPEGRGVFADLTVLENLEMGGYLIKKALFKTKLDEVYSLFPILKDRQKQKAGLLSGGEQQMLSIARALIGSPKLLLLDEPALGLAPLVIRELFRIIVDINRKSGTTILLIEQNAGMALEVSGFGYVMETGTIVLSGPAHDLLHNPQVKAAYLGE